VTGEDFKSGFVALAGRPNTGKSTLLNALCGQKVAIVSDRPETTRRAVRGIRTTPEYQMVFVDTPGIHKPRTLLGERLNSLARGTLGEVDIGVLVVDAAAGVGRGDEFAARWILEATTCALAVANKIDACTRDQVTDALGRLAAIGQFEEYVPTSAARGQGVELLAALIAARLPDNPALYPEEMVTDTPLEVRAAEIVREKLIGHMTEELPHSVAVVVDDIHRRDDGLYEIEARILVERDSQKGIVIGTGGGILKAAGSAAREELELLLGDRVYLELRVGIEKDWQRRPAGLNRLGF
jgi:GTP-binding protein Era